MVNWIDNQKMITISLKIAFFVRYLASCPMQGSVQGPLNIFRLKVVNLAGTRINHYQIFREGRLCSGSVEGN